MTRDTVMSMTADQLRIEIAKALEYYIPSKESAHESGMDYQSCLDKFMPNWPNSIEAAWGLVEDIRKNGDEISINSDRNGNNEDMFVVVVLRFRNDNLGTAWNQLVNVESDTLQFAISRAWLIWHEEKERKG